MQKNNKAKIIRLVLIIIAVIAVCYISTGVVAFTVVSKYNNKMYPNVYISDYDISGLDENKIEQHIQDISDSVEEKDIILVVNGKEYSRKLKELGISINKTKLFNNIKTYKNNMSYFSKLKKVFTSEKTVFSYECSYNEEVIRNFLKKLKTEVDTKLQNGKLIVNNHNVYYEKGKSSFSLDVDKSYNVIIDAFPDILTTYKIDLVGVSISPSEDSLLSPIDTKVASYTTTFINGNSRANNIKNAVRYINGAIIKPGETFSFYKYAGPYSKSGYEYYDGTIGSGVCQVATTMYNVELLAGLKTVERYSHAYKMVYVPGGLDATVASTTTYNKLDFKFKNTYKYAIYISAWTNGGNLTIEFWSNKNAKEGKTYKTVSEQIGTRGYQTYLLTYKDGKQISKTKIATTWYPK